MSVVDETRLKAKIAGRKLCEEIVLLIAGEVRELNAQHGDAAAESFWENFRTAFEGHFPQPPATETAPALKPMDDFEVKQFEQQTLNFGQHRGRRIADIPKGYLEWLAYNDDELKTELKRYLLSERVRNEQDDTDDDNQEETL